MGIPVMQNRIEIDKFLKISGAFFFYCTGIGKNSFKGRAAVRKNPIGVTPFVAIQAD
jgi:hypothetical protein